MADDITDTEGLRPIAWSLEIDNSVVPDRQVLRDAADEIERLRRWKAEATEVLAQWDVVAEQIIQQLDFDDTVGRRKPDIVADEIERLRTELDEEQQRRRDDLLGQQHRDDEIKRLRALNDGAFTASSLDTNNGELKVTNSWAECDEWLNHGVTQGWISLPVCSTHDGLPMTPEEIAEWEDHCDPCIPALRLWNR